MTSEMTIDLVRQALRLVLLLGGPLLAVILLAGLVCSVLQAITQVHEHTLSFVPKLVAAAGAVALGLPWLLYRLVEYASDLIGSIPYRL
jgi:flagellar biosynthetic protein FliQ